MSMRRSIDTMSFTRCIVVLLLLFTSLNDVSGENRFQRILMMDRNPPKEPKDCVAPEALELAKEELKAAEAARDEAKAEHQKALDEMKKVKSELGALKEETKVRFEQLDKSSEAAAKMAAVQNDFAKQLAEVQARSAKELQETKTNLSQKEKELAAAKVDYEKKIQIQKTNADQTVKETEDRWKKSLENAEESSKKRITDLETAKEQEIRQKVEAARKENEEALSETKRQVKALEEEKARLNGEKISLEKIYATVEEKYEAKLQEEEEEKELYFRGELADEVAKKAEEIDRKWKQEFEALKKEKEKLFKGAEDKAKKEIDKLRSQLNTDKKKTEEMERSLKQEEETLLKEAETKSENEIKKLRAQHDADKKKLMAEVNAAKKKEMDEIRAAHAKEIDEIRAAHAKEIEKLHGEIKAKMDAIAGMKKKNADLQKDLNAMRKKHELAVKDAKHWETLFNQRSYINLTHVTSDATEALRVAHKATSTKLDEARRSVATAAAPYTEKTQKLYDQHMKTRVNTVVDRARPQYDAHVVPAVDLAAGKMKEARRKVNDMLAAAFSELVARFRKVCPHTLSTLKGIKGMPSSVTDSVKHSCDEPEESVSTFLKALAILFAFIFRRTLWGLVWGPIWTVLVIIWFFSPFRLLFGRSKKADAQEAHNGNGVSGETHLKSE